MKNLGTSIAIVLSVVAVGIAYFAPTTTQVKEVVREIERIGAIPGNVIDSNCLSIGGLERCYYRVPFANATGTACVVPLPAGTSTLISFHARGTTATGTASSLYLATSTNRYAPDSVGSTATSSSIASGMYAAGIIPQFTVFGGALSTGNNDDGLGGVTTISATSSLNVVLDGGTGTSSLVLFARGGGILNDTFLSAPYTGVCTAIIEKF